MYCPRGKISLLNILNQQNTLKNPTETKKTTSKKAVVNRKKVVNKQESNVVLKELSALSRILSGESKLSKEQKKIENQKVDAIKRQRNLSRKNVIKGKVAFDKDDSEGKEIVQNRTLFTWEAPVRPPVNFEMKTFFGIVAVSLLFVLYLAILGHYWLMIVIIALLFLLYVVGTTPPIIVSHKITARGIDSFGKLYEWFSLSSFWFAKKNETTMMYVETRLRMPSRLIFVVTEEDMSAIFVLLEKKLLYKDVRNQRRFDKVMDGIYVPLEKI